MQVNSHFAGMIVGLISYHFFKFPLMITLIIIRRRQSRPGFPIFQNMQKQ